MVSDSGQIVSTYWSQWNEAIVLSTLRYVPERLSGPPIDNFMEQSSSSVIFYLLRNTIHNSYFLVKEIPSYMSLFVVIV
jgi:hypothetical protein